MNKPASEQRSITRINLEQFEPAFRFEEGGLLVEGFDIDGRLTLNFDWDSSGPLAFLDDKAVFRRFIVVWLEDLLGCKLDPADLEELDASIETGWLEEDGGSSGQDLAGEVESQGSDQPVENG